MRNCLLAPPRPEPLSDHLGHRREASPHEELKPSSSKSAEVAEETSESTVTGP